MLGENMAKELSRSTKELQSTLDFYQKREDCTLLKGTVVLDRNIQGNVIVVVSSTEFYSVRQSDIIENDEDDQSVWVQRGARVWLCQATSLEDENLLVEKASKQLSLISAPDLENIEAYFAPDETPKPPPTEQEKAILRFYELSPDDLDRSFATLSSRKLFRGNANPFEAIWTWEKGWPVNYLRQPTRDEYVTRINKAKIKINSMRRFINLFR
jgi:hypothetical protein